MAYTQPRPSFIANGIPTGPVITGTELVRLQRFPSLREEALVEFAFHASSPLMAYDLQRADSNDRITMVIRTFGAFGHFWVHINSGDLIKLVAFGNPPEGTLVVQASLYGWI